MHSLNMRLLAGFACLLIKGIAIAADPKDFELPTFLEVRDALLSGSRLQLTAQTEECVVSEPDAFRSVNMVLKQWQVVKNPDGTEEIRADDFSPMNGAETISFALRTVNIYEDGSTKITVSSVVGDVQTEPLVIECSLGSGAVVRHVEDPKDLIPITYFNGLKSHILTGERVEVIGQLHKCLNADQIFQAGAEYTLGYELTRYVGHRDGADDEDIVFDDFALLSADGTSFSLGVEKVVAIKEGERADVTTLVFDGLDLSSEPVLNFTLNCVINESMFFSRHELAPTDIFVTYGEVRQAALAGFQIQVFMSLETCRQLEGEILPTAGEYVGLQFDQLQLFRAGEVWGSKEYMAFSSWGVTVDGNPYLEIVRFDQDSTATLEYLVEARDGSGIIMNGKLDCPVFTSTFFNGNGRVREPVDSFEALMTDMAAGYTFEVEVDFDGCNTGGADLSSIYVGVLWQAYFDSVDGYYVGTAFSLVNQEVTGEKGVGWQVAEINVNADLSVEINNQLYDFLTGDLISGAEEPIRCTLKIPDNRGSVRLFRYP